jgi:hypothetical protein
MISRGGKADVPNRSFQELLKEWKDYVPQVGGKDLYESDDLRIHSRFFGKTDPEPEDMLGDWRSRLVSTPDNPHDVWHVSDGRSGGSLNASDDGPPVLIEVSQLVNDIER